MSREGHHSELTEKTRHLMEGPLKHIRAAALAAVLVPLASVAVSKAVAQNNCCGCAPPASVPSPCDFVTSGGFVLTDSGTKANFGAHGGCKKDAFWGHVNYVDHDSGYHLNSIEITAYSTPDPSSNVRDICGTATSNAPESQPVWFHIRLIDNGEPGIADQFGIWLSNGQGVPTRLLNGGLSGGGNVQLHEPNPSTTGPDPAPDQVALFGLCGEVPEP